MVKKCSICCRNCQSERFFYELSLSSTATEHLSQHKRSSKNDSFSWYFARPRSTSPSRVAFCFSDGRLLAWHLWTRFRFDGEIAFTSNQQLQLGNPFNSSIAELNSGVSCTRGRGHTSSSVDIMNADEVENRFIEGLEYHRKQQNPLLRRARPSIHSEQTFDPIMSGGREALMPPENPLVDDCGR